MAHSVTLTMHVDPQYLTFPGYPRGARGHGGNGGGQARPAGDRVVAEWAAGEETREATLEAWV